MPRKPRSDPETNRHLESSRKLWRDHRRLISMVVADLFRFRPRSGRRASQTSRRAYARALFAVVEAETSCMAASTLHDWIHHLGEDEQLSLRQRRRIQTSDGKVLEVPHHRSPAENFHCACDLYCDTWGGVSPINKRSPGWNALLSAQRIRNRITHPARSADLEISDRDLKTLCTADEWVLKAIYETANEVYAANLRQMEKLERIITRRHRRKARQPRSAHQLSLDLDRRT